MDASPLIHLLCYLSSHTYFIFLYDFWSIFSYLLKPENDLYLQINKPKFAEFIFKFCSLLSKGNIYV